VLELPLDPELLPDLEPLLEPVLPPPELPALDKPVPPLEPEVVLPELPLDAEPLELEPLPEAERSPALPVLEPHEKTRQTAMPAATEEASVIAVVGERVIPVLSRLEPPAAQDVG
jgi:hypothetical protein